MTYKTASPSCSSALPKYTHPVPLPGTWGRERCSSKTSRGQGVQSQANYHGPVGSGCRRHPAASLGVQDASPAKTIDVPRHALGRPTSNPSAARGTPSAPLGRQRPENGDLLSRPAGSHALYAALQLHTKARTSGGRGFRRRRWPQQLHWFQSPSNCGLSTGTARYAAAGRNVSIVTGPYMAASTCLGAFAKKASGL